jgi:DNA replication licensing factor MCM2
MAEVADDFEDDIDEVQDLEDVDDEIDAEDLFGENMMRYRILHQEILITRDYRENAEADFYDPTNLDDDNMYDDLDPETRRRVEAQLNRRDREIARRGGFQRPPAFLDSGRCLCRSMLTCR